MITALVSAVTGLVSGIVPEVMKEVRDSRAAAREMEFLKLNHDLTMARVKSEAGVKLEQGHMEMLTQEIAATKEQLVAIVTEQARPTGIAWIDGLNALIRPATSIMLMLVFVAGILGFSFGITNNDAFGVAMTGLFGESIMAVLGFMFGYRSSQKLAKVA